MSTENPHGRIGILAVLHEGGRIEALYGSSNFGELREEARRIWQDAPKTAVRVTVLINKGAPIFDRKVVHKVVAPAAPEPKKGK